jgi:hypothetical protein
VFPLCADQQLFAAGLGNGAQHIPHRLAVVDSQLTAASQDMDPPITIDLKASIGGRKHVGR